MDASHSNDLHRLTELWNEAQPVVSAFVHGHVRNFHDSEDLVQEIACTVADRFRTYDGERPFTPWALGIARFKILEYYRKQNRTFTLLEQEVAEEAIEVFVEESEEYSSFRGALKRCIARLTERSRLLLELRYVHDMKPMAIARYLGFTPGATRTALHKIRSALGDCIDRAVAQEGRS